MRPADLRVHLRTFTRSAVSRFSRCDGIVAELTGGEAALAAGRYQ